MSATPAQLRVKLDQLRLRLAVETDTSAIPDPYDESDEDTPDEQNAQQNDNEESLSDIEDDTRVLDDDILATRKSNQAKTDLYEINSEEIEFTNDLD